MQGKSKIENALRILVRIFALGNLILFALLLFGCGGRIDGNSELWIVTEDPGYYAASLRLPEKDTVLSLEKWAVARFADEHPGVQVKLEILPVEKKEREDRLEQLRTQIMAGGGPDGYLLPTRLFGGRQALFHNVPLAMDNGMFADIRAFYDADAELDTQSLRQDIMDAGVVDGKRYLLPMRYNMHVIYADAGQLAANGVDSERLCLSVYSFYDAVAASGRRDWKQTGIAALRQGWAILPPAFDETAREVALSPEELETYFRRVRQWESQDDPTGSFAPIDIWGYWNKGKTIEKDSPLSIQRLNEIVPMAAIAKNEGTSLMMLPLPGVDGKTAAEITFYGAVAANSKHPDLAHALLRELLTPEAQWEGDRSPEDSMVLASAGFPVRSLGAAGPIWEQYKLRLEKEADERRTTTKRQRELLDICISDEDIPLLTESVDRVYFGNAFLDELLYQRLNQVCTGETLPSAQTDAEAAAALLEDLEQYLAEG